MNVLSLFDGISIAQQSLKELNIPVEKYYASEIDKYAISITQKNFPDTIQLGDVSKLGREVPYPEELLNGGCDLIIFGSPCTDLSIAKKNREGLKGKSSGLFYEAVRIIKDIKPKYFIMENVNSMPKEAKQMITAELFGIEPIMINAALVSAQNRKRLFWVGKRVEDTYERVEISQPEDKGILLKDILEDEVDEKYYVKLSDRWNTKRLKEDCVGYNPYSDTPINDKARALNTVCGSATTKNATTIKVGHINSDGQGDRIYSPEGKSVNLSANGGGRGAKTGLYAITPNGYVTNDSKPEIGQARRVYQPEGKVVPLNNWSPLTNHNQQIRKLTPIECEKLQSLPKNYTAKGITEKGEINISDTQRYKLLGNGFNCEVIKHILRQL